MDSKEKRFETINLGDLSQDSQSMISGGYTTDSLTISSISLTDSLSGPTYSISGTSGSVLGATGSNYPNTVWTTNGTSAVDWSVGSINQSSSIELRGNDADIRVNGRSLMDAIDALEQRLNILVPNPELEAEWDELRELGERYRELEKKCQEKGDMWAKLKSMPAPLPK
jgi:hypothetical protein